MSAIAEQKEQLVRDILPAIVAGDKQSVSRFFEIFSDDIYSFPQRFHGFNEDDAGDFYVYAFTHLQDGRKLSSFQGKSRFTTWFFAVLRNLVIDFLRSRGRSVPTVSAHAVDDSGEAGDWLENIPNPENQDPREEALIDALYEALEDLKTPERVTFKLAYLQYMDLDTSELRWLSETSGLELPQLLQELARLREHNLNRSRETTILEDRITDNFQHIRRLEQKVYTFFRDNPEILPNEKEWTEDYIRADAPVEIIEAIRQLSKRRRRHISLIREQRKGLESIKAPYRELARLLNRREGVLSVQIMRIIEKIQRSVDRIPEEKL